jgi:putative phage-type endonuclease
MENLPNNIPEYYAKLLRTAYAPQGSDAWLKVRNSIVSGTTIGPICGNGKYQSALDVFKSQNGLVEPFCGNKFTAHGIKYEPLARRRLEELTGGCCYELGLVLHETIPGLGASPDGLMYIPAPDQDLPGEWVGVEIKNPYQARVAQDDVPEHYKDQVQLVGTILQVQTMYFFNYRPAECSDSGKEEYCLIKKAVDPNYLNGDRVQCVERYLKALELYRKDYPEWQERMKQWKDLVHLRTEFENARIATALAPDILPSCVYTPYEIEQRFSLVQEEIANPTPLKKYMGWLCLSRFALRSALCEESLVEAKRNHTAYEAQQTLQQGKERDIKRSRVCPDQLSLEALFQQSALTLLRHKKAVSPEFQPKLIPLPESKVLDPKLINIDFIGEE